MNEVLLVAGMMLVTFGVRYPALVMAGRIQLPHRVIRALAYVPVAVLTAIVAPVVLMPEGNMSLHPDNAYLIGAVVAIVVSWRTKSLLWTIVASMAVFLLWHGIW